MPVFAWNTYLTAKCIVNRCSIYLVFGVLWLYARKEAESFQRHMMNGRCFIDQVAREVSVKDCPFGMLQLNEGHRVK